MKMIRRIVFGISSGVAMLVPLALSEALTLRNYRNLKNINLCIAPGFIGVSSDDNSLDESDLQKLLFPIVQNKLDLAKINYRVAPCESFNDQYLFINYSISKPIGAQNSRGYNIQLLIFEDDLSSFPDGIVTYLANDSGVVINYSNSDLASLAQNSVKDLFDLLNADNQKANP